MACLRPISPSEYDAVLRLRPAECLPAAMGDLRCGRQLLLAAGADRARPLRASLEGVRVRVTVDGLAAVVEAAAGELERSLAPLPQVWPFASPRPEARGEGAAK
jgi:hypothetical protein